MRKWAILLLSAVLLLSAAGVSHAAEETMPEAKTFGELLFELGLVKGTDKGLEEDQTLNRAQLITLLVRLGERENPDGVQLAFTPPPVPTFSDVPTSHWAYAEIERAYQEGITVGIGGGRFGPGSPVTYRQAVTFLIRAAGHEINYDYAVEEGLSNWGVTLMADKEPSAVLLRADVFELIVSTLFVEYGDTEQFLLDLLPGIADEQKDKLMTDWLAAYNPYAPTIRYYPYRDEYEGGNALFAEASRRQQAYETAVAEAIAPFIGRGKPMALDDFLRESGADGALSFAYAWSSYMEWGEGPAAFWGSTLVTVAADGHIYAHIDSTEGEQDFTAEIVAVKQFGPVKLGDRMLSAYSLHALIPMALAGYNEPFLLFVLADEDGAYCVAAIGSYGDGVYVRE